MRPGLGLLPASGRGRSARRHQYPVAAVRYRQPDAGRHGADALRGRAVQNEASALRMGGAVANLMVVDLYADRWLAKSL
ncbi:hypothetical protein D3C80_828790 [compost metagenome]